jgi:sugar lactone lactonase YvrE
MVFLTVWKKVNALVETGSNEVSGLAKRQSTETWTTSIIAGGGTSWGSTNGLGTVARFRSPVGTNRDSSGNIYVANKGNHIVRKITPYGTVTTFAGSAGITGSIDGVGSAARFNQPYDIAIDSFDNLYVPDCLNHLIRIITPCGSVTTFAGAAEVAGSTDGVGSSASPSGITIDSMGTFYVTDTGNHIIRKITPTGNVTTIAVTAGSAGNVDGIGNAARFSNPHSLTVDSVGNLYITDADSVIRKITSNGTVSTFAGSVGINSTTDGVGSSASFNSPIGITVDVFGNLFVGEYYNAIRKITPTAIVTTIASAGSPVGFSMNSNGEIFIVEHIVGGYIKILTLSETWNVSKFAGTVGVSGTVDGTGTFAKFQQPIGIAIDSDGNFFVAEHQLGHCIRKITPTGTVTTFAGTPGVSGTNDGVGSTARLNELYGVAIDSSNNLYIADLPLLLEALV